MEDKLLLTVMQKNARIKMTDLAAVLDEPKDKVIREGKSYLRISYSH